MEKFFRRLRTEKCKTGIVFKDEFSIAYGVFLLQYLPGSKFTFAVFHPDVAYTDTAVTGSSDPDSFRNFVIGNGKGAVNKTLITELDHRRRKYGMIFPIIFQGNLQKIITKEKL